MMTPNLFVAAKTAVQPHKWFQGSGSKPQADAVEHRDQPLPGTYKHFKGRGWYLVAVDGEDDNDAADKMFREPEKVVYSKCLHRWLFETEYKERSRLGCLPGPSARRPSTPSPSASSERRDGGLEVGFFLMDDGLTWINNLDHEGYFIPGPYQPFVIDKQTPSETFFREMTFGDSRHGTPAQSRSNSRVASRNAGGDTSRSQSRPRSRRSSPDSANQRSRIEAKDLTKSLQTLSVTPRGRQSDTPRPTSLVVPRSNRRESAS